MLKVRSQERAYEKVMLVFSHAIDTLINAMNPTSTQSE